MIVNENGDGDLDNKAVRAPEDVESSDINHYGIFV